MLCDLRGEKGGRRGGGREGKGKIKKKDSTCPRCK